MCITFQMCMFRTFSENRVYASVRNELNTNVYNIQSSKNREVDGSKMINEETVFLTTVNDCRRHSLIIIILSVPSVFVSRLKLNENASSPGYRNNKLKSKTNNL